MTSEKLTFHQRRYLVDKRFQIKYTLMVVAFSSIVFWVLGYWLYQKAVATTEILKIQNLDVQGMIVDQDRQVLYVLLGFFVLQIASLFVLGILLTHRIAGPVHRVQRYLEEAAETGELKELNPVRNEDEFHEFFNALSRFIHIFQDRAEKLKAEIERLKQK